MLLNQYQWDTREEILQIKNKKEMQAGRELWASRESHMMTKLWQYMRTQPVVAPVLMGCQSQLLSQAWLE